MANIIKYEARDGQSVELTFETIKRFLVHGKPEFVTQQEMIFFMGICKARGLNPFAKDCYLIKYTPNDPAAIITSIDYFRARAKAQPDCKGWSSGIIVRDRESGETKYTRGLIQPDKEELIGGWFRAKPAGWETDFELEVNLSGYLKKTKDGNLTRFWQPENQPTMIRKIAESQGLRECWPAEFGKLYTPEEVDAGQVMDAAFEASSRPARTLDVAPETGEVKADPYAVQEAPQAPEEPQGSENAPGPEKDKVEIPTGPPEKPKRGRPKKEDVPEAPPAEKPKVDEEPPPFEPPGEPASDEPTPREIFHDLVQEIGLPTVVRILRNGFDIKSPDDVSDRQLSLVIDRLLVEKEKRAQ